ncbi:MAG: glycosyltransferase family 87 protein, partial [Anaerolineales bacterium]
VYDHELPESRDQQGFAYPAIFLPLIIPFGFIPDLEIATAVWQGLNTSCLILSLYYFQYSSSTQKIPPLFFAATWYFTLLMIFQAQNIGILIAGLSFGYWALTEKKQLLGGVISSVLFIKPNLTFLPILVLILYALFNQEIRYLLGLFIGTSTLLIISFLLVGPWIQGWLGILLRYSGYAKTTFPIMLLSDYSLPLGGLLVSSILIGFVIFRKHLLYLLAWSVPAQIILFPQTPIWSLSILTIPMVVVWMKGQKFPVLIYWFLGWLSLLGNIISPSWWQWQSLTIAILSFGLIIYSSYITNTTLNLTMLN